jgi:hypothetical protein
MSTTDQLEAELLRLPPRDRERLALAAWESLEEITAWLADPETDREGIAVARERDAGIESGQAAPISHEEFLRRTRATGQ